MKLNFLETIKSKTDKELELIAKDYSFYSDEERLIALKELESRNCLTEELTDIKDTSEMSDKTEEERQAKHRISIIDLIPGKNYIFTPVLIYINVLIFIIMVISGVDLLAPDITSLLKWGGNLRYLTLDGNYWRLLSSVFLHAGIFHLAFNMYALLYIGSVLETVIGKNKFIVAYILSGISASVSSIFVNDNIVSVGASGAIFGLFGVLLALLLFKEFKLPNISKKSLLSSVGLFVVYNLIYGFGKTGIDNAAHVGGLVSGLAIGILYFLMIKKRIYVKVGYCLIIALIGLVSVFSLSHTIPGRNQDFEVKSKIYDKTFLYSNKKFSKTITEKIINAIRQSQFMDPKHESDLFLSEINDQYILKFVLPDFKTLSDSAFLYDFNIFQTLINTNSKLSKKIAIQFTNPELTQIQILPIVKIEDSKPKEISPIPYKGLANLQKYNINFLQSVYYASDVPLADVTIVAKSITKLSTYFPPDQRMDIIFIKKGKYYVTKFFINPDLWENFPFADKLRSTVGYFKSAGIQKEIKIIIINSNDHREKEI